MADDMSVAKVLGEFGKAISPQGSVAGRVGGAASEMATNEANRRFLSTAMGSVPQLKGQYGLSPEFVMKAISLKSDLEQAESQMRSRSITDKARAVRTKQKLSQMENRVPVEVGGKTVQMDPARAATVKLQRRKLERQISRDFPSIEEWNNLSDEEKDNYREYIQAQATSSGFDPNEIMAEYMLKSQAEARTEIGTVSDLADRAKTFSSNEVNKFSTENELRSSDEARRVLAIQSAAEELKQRLPQYTSTEIRQNPNNPNIYGIVGVTKDGKPELIQRIDITSFGTD